ncbi:YncE family protein [Flavicella sediminum]|uniref:YncE family protein n=1 Tax=Flavicella sediminum TaxID=2585141 RepID=UPI001124068E|nr:cell surface protein [Flavicella sediminum]
MKINKLILQSLVLAVLFISCNDNEVLFNGEGASYKNGILISGEGSSAGTGSVSFISNDFSVQANQIFKTINNEELGTYLQSIAFDDENAYISVDNAATITVVDRYTFEEKGKIITGLDHPRYMTVVDGIGYSTNWGSTGSETDDYIAVIDLSTFEVTSTIPVGNGPERIIEKDGNLYVSHQGAFTTNNIVSVINIDTESIVEITVNDNPDEIFFDNAGDLIVLSAGNVVADYSNWPEVTILSQTPGSIARINTASNTITSELTFAEGDHPKLLVENDNNFYYSVGNKIYKIAANSAELSDTPILEVESIYSMAIKNNKLFSVNASYSKLSKLSVFDLSTKEETNTFNVALAASKIYFN